MNNVELRNLNNVSSALPLERKSAVKHLICQSTERGLELVSLSHA